MWDSGVLEWRSVEEKGSGFHAPSWGAAREECFRTGQWQSARHNVTWFHRYIGKIGNLDGSLPPARTYNTSFVMVEGFHSGTALSSEFFTGVSNRHREQTKKA